MGYTKLTVTVIGVENNFGINLTRKLCKGNFRVVMFDENLAEAKSIRDSINKEISRADIDIVDCKHMASWEADIIIIATEYPEIESVAKKIVDVSTQKIIAILLSEASQEKLEEMEKLFPHSKVSILTPVHDQKVSLSSSDGRAVETLQELLKEVGYESDIQFGQLTR